MFFKFFNENSEFAMKPYTKNEDEFPYIQDIGPRQELKSFTLGINLSKHEVNQSLPVSPKVTQCNLPA
jgi:hypothetical protein